MLLRSSRVWEGDAAMAPRFAHIFRLGFQAAPVSGSATASLATRSAMNRCTAAVVTIAAGLLVLAAHSTVAHAAVINCAAAAECPIDAILTSWKAQSARAITYDPDTLAADNIDIIKFSAPAGSTTTITFRDTVAGGAGAFFKFALEIEITGVIDVPQVIFVIQDLDPKSRALTLEDHPRHAHIHPDTVLPLWDNTKGSKFSCVPASTENGCTNLPDPPAFDFTYNMLVDKGTEAAVQGGTGTFMGQVLRLHDRDQASASSAMKYTLSISVLVPEPSTGLLLSFGLAALAVGRRHRAL